MLFSTSLSRKCRDLVSPFLYFTWAEVTFLWVGLRVHKGEQFIGQVVIKIEERLRLRECVNDGDRCRGQG